jgi:hypothetical protein
MIHKIASEYKNLEGLPFPLEAIHKEIKDIGSGHEEYSHLERSIRNFKLDGKNSSNDRYLKFLLYCYTEEACYSKINNMIAGNDFSKMQKYMASVMLQSYLHGAEHAYKSISEPVYRGTNTRRVKLDNYKPGSIGFWKTFTSTSKDYNVAESYS